MQFIIIFVICLAVVLFYMLVLGKRKKTDSCGCGQGHCQSDGGSCQNPERKEKDN